MTRRVDQAMSVCPSVSTQTSLLVLKLSGWKVLFILQVVYKSEPAGSDNYIFELP